MKGDFVCQENFAAENFAAVDCFLDRESTSQYRGKGLRVITPGVRYQAKNT